jgi:pimeloyl-ACP methyl ester carboxylesterase
VPFERAILHEPAVGSLQPGQLDAVAAAYSLGGMSEFARTLYGPSWRAEFAPLDPDAVSRDLSMFRRFEPRAPAAGSGQVIITVGSESPRARHAAAAALADLFGYKVRVLAGCKHAVHIDAPAILAQLIVSLRSRPTDNATGPR